MPTLQMLARPDAPPFAYFTDLCEEAALRAAQAAAACFRAAGGDPDPGKACANGAINAARSAASAKGGADPGRDAAGAAQEGF